MKSSLVPIPTILALLYNIPKFFELTSCINPPDVLQNSTDNEDTFTLIDHQENQIRLNETIAHFGNNSDNISSASIRPIIISSHQPLNELSLIRIQDMFNLTNKEVIRHQVEEEFNLCEEGYEPTSLRSNWWYIVLYLCWSKFGVTGI